MDNWITLQETANRIGVRKGTLAMWRTRDRFPFETKGTHRNLMVSEASVENYLKTHPKGTTRPGRKKGFAFKGLKAPRGKECTLTVQGELDLATVHRFVNDIQSGANVQISPAREGFTITTIR